MAPRPGAGADRRSAGLLGPRCHLLRLKARSRQRLTAAPAHLKTVRRGVNAGRRRLFAASTQMWAQIAHHQCSRCPSRSTTWPASRQASTTALAMPPTSPSENELVWWPSEQASSLLPTSCSCATVRVLGFQSQHPHGSVVRPGAQGLAHAGPFFVFEKPFTS